MNLTTVIVLLVWALILIRSFRRGFVKTLFSMVFLILVIILTAAFSPKMQTYLAGNETVKNWVQEKCREYIDDKAGQTESTPAAADGAGSSASGNAADSGTPADGSGTSVTGSGSAFSWLNLLPLPDDLRKNLEAGNESILGLLLQSDTVRNYLAERLAGVMIGVLAVVITLILAIVVLAVIEALLSHFAFAALPGIVNRIFGLLLGILKCLLLTWIFLAVISLLATFRLGGQVAEQVQSSIVLAPLYKNNLLMQYLPELLKKML